MKRALRIAVLLTGLALAGVSGWAIIGEFGGLAAILALPIGVYIGFGVMAIQVIFLSPECDCDECRSKREAHGEAVIDMDLVTLQTVANSEADLKQENEMLKQKVQELEYRVQDWRNRYKAISPPGGKYHPEDASW